MLYASMFEVNLETIEIDRGYRIFIKTKKSQKIVKIFRKNYFNIRSGTRKHEEKKLKKYAKTQSQ